MKKKRKKKKDNGSSYFNPLELLKKTVWFPLTIIENQIVKTQT